MTFPWTEERVEELRKCVAEGMSATAAAASMGISRSSALGKAFRLKIPWSCPGRRKAERQNKQSMLRLAKPRKSPLVPKPQRFTPFRAPPIAPPTSPDAPPRAIPPAPNCRPVDLMRLNNETCHWPLWTDEEPVRLYCGALEADVEAGRSYCWFHARAAKG